MKVLIVEDSRTKQDIICDALNDLGIEDITVAVNAYECNMAMDNNTFDLLILDNNFPLRFSSPVQARAGEKLLYRLENVLHLREVVDRLKIIMFTSDDVDLGPYSSNILGLVKYDSTVNYFEELKSLITKAMS